MKIKTTNKIGDISKQICGFLQVLIAPLTLPKKTMCLGIFFFSKPPPLDSPKSPHHDSKPTKFQNSN
jgi:hypothetical protein